MFRLFIGTALFVFAGELLGGCAQTRMVATSAAAAPQPGIAAKAATDARETDAAARRKAKAAALVADAHKLYDATQFREAQDLLRQAAIIDPQDETAALFYRIVSTKIADRDYEAIQHRAGTEVMRQNTDNAEHLIPYTDLVVYPDNWPETTRRRTDATAGK